MIELGGSSNVGSSSEPAATLRLCEGGSFTGTQPRVLRGLLGRGSQRLRAISLFFDFRLNLKIASDLGKIDNRPWPAVRTRRASTLAREQLFINERIGMQDQPTQLPADPLLSLSIPDSRASCRRIPRRHTQSRRAVRPSCDDPASRCRERCAELEAKLRITLRPDRARPETREGRGTRDLTGPPELDDSLVLVIGSLACRARCPREWLTRSTVTSTVRSKWRCQGYGAASNRVVTGTRVPNSRQPAHEPRRA
jgi:hypothetical protein